MQFIDLKAQYNAYKAEFDAAISGVVQSAQFIMGNEVIHFEKELSSYTGSPHAITCASGTDALLLALMALDVGQGDEVITTPFTFIATAEVISFLGATPVFVDIDESSYNIDPALIEAKITNKTKAIIPVSLYGQIANMHEINQIASHHNVTVIEDGAQSFGAMQNGKKSCNLSTIGCTSFFPSKPLGAYGDGGALFTDDALLAKKIASMRIHGQTKRYTHKYVGINGRLDTMQAAILRVKLSHFDDELQIRNRIAQRYTEALQNDVITPVIFENNTSAWAQYSIRLQQRDALIDALKTEGIPTAVHYPTPLHLQEAFASLDYKEGDFPISEAVAKSIVSLPMSPFLSQEDQETVIKSVLKNR
ncbi:DegT/DnrJ/EryC1/StrS family aminotransferase [bacterium]|nr:DegT/DnrJ/EryC1/StrS family aminotransferase [bacterium]